MAPKTLPEVILPRLKRVLEFGDKFHNIFYTWDPLTKQVQPKNRKLVRLTMICSLVYVILQVTSIFINRKSTSFIELFQGSLFSFAYFSILFLRWEWAPNPDTAQLLNLLCKGLEQNGNIR